MMITLEDYRKLLINKYFKKDETGDKEYRILHTGLSNLGFFYVEEDTVDDLFGKSLAEIDPRGILNTKIDSRPVSEQIDIKNTIESCKSIILKLNRLRKTVQECSVEDSKNNTTCEFWLKSIKTSIQKVYRLMSRIVFENPEYWKVLDKKSTSLIKDYQSSREGFMLDSNYENRYKDIDRFTQIKDTKEIKDIILSHKDALSGILSYKSNAWGETISWYRNAGEQKHCFNTDTAFEYGVIGFIKDIMQTEIKNDPKFIAWLQNVKIDYTPEDLKDLIKVSEIYNPKDEEAINSLSGVDALEVIWAHENEIWETLFYDKIVNVPIRPVRTFISCINLEKIKKS